MAISVYEESINCIEELLEQLEVPPDRNCSCHLHPPCSDCVDWSHLRETRTNAKDVIKHLQAHQLLIS
jgi:hypothetical protein